MAVFLFVTAAVAVVLGLVSLVRGYWPRAAWHRKAPRAPIVSRFRGVD
jgi:hypothetical protein